LDTGRTGINTSRSIAGYWKVEAQAKAELNQVESSLDLDLDLSLLS
jgi:hypothetical protein